jgi:hypothetical protein
MKLLVNQSSGIIVTDHPRQGGAYREKPTATNPSPLFYPVDFYPELEIVEINEKMLKTDVAFNYQICSLVKTGVVILLDNSFENVREVEVGDKIYKVPAIDTQGYLECETYFNQLITDPMHIKEFEADNAIPKEKRGRPPLNKE